MRIGVDLGGTKIEAIALDDSGVIRARQRHPAPQRDYNKTIAAVAALVAAIEAEADVGPSPVGLGMPGGISPGTGLVQGANSTWLIGHPFDKDLAAALQRPLKVANDANCFAVSEASDGAAAGVPIVFGVILGTGVGGGIVVNGRPLTGANAISGEWGHNPLPWPRDDERPGPACFCGQHGCIETWLAGPGMARDHLRTTGQSLDAAGIVAAAEAGDEKALATMARHEERLARGLAHVVNIVDPQIIVLGGGLSNIKRLYANLPGLMRPFIFSDHVATRIVPPRHGDSSGVRGAAWLWTPGEAPGPIPGKSK
jgi:fructokinase